MFMLGVFGLYFVGMGVATMRRGQFRFTRRPLTGRAATIAGEANIGSGVLIALALAWSNPLPAIGIAVIVFCVGLCAAFTWQSMS